MTELIDLVLSVSNDAWTAIFTGGLLLTAVATAWYAGLQWRSSRLHHKEQIKAQKEAVRPYVLVTVETSKAAFNLFDLVIRNIGKRPAVDVRISLDPPPIRANEMREQEIQMKNMKLLNEPMSLLAPDQEIRAFYDSHIDRKDREDLPTVHRAKVDYRDMSGNPYTTDFTLDILALKGMSQTTVGTVHEVYKSLEKIAKTLSSAKVLQRSPELEVHAITEPKPAFEARELQERYDAAKANSTFIPHITRGRESGKYYEDLMVRLRGDQRELAAEPLRSGIRNIKHSFGFLAASVRDRAAKAVVRRRGLKGTQ